MHKTINLFLNFLIFLCKKWINLFLFPLRQNWVKFQILKMDKLMCYGHGSKNIKNKIYK